MQNLTNVLWDVTLTDLVLLPSTAFTRANSIAGLVTDAVKMTTGAPTATAGKFIPGALIRNAVSGLVYQNTGSSASPVWSALENSASGFTLPINETDATTTTGTSFAMALTALTTGIGESITAVLATTAKIYRAVAASLTTGIIYEAVAAIANLTTGRYFSANDGATEVWGIGANGHIHSKVSASAPSILITTAQGITAVALTAGATDTCGVITSTGTQNNTADSTFTLTFGKTYTAAPKGVMISAANAAAALAAQSGIYVSSVSATAVVFGIPKSSAAAATPSWNYTIIA